MPQGRSRDQDPLEELQQDEVSSKSPSSHIFAGYQLSGSKCHILAKQLLVMIYLILKKASVRTQVVELNHRLKEVAVDLNQRIRQELAFPAVVHFYSWLLQGGGPAVHQNPSTHISTLLCNRQPWQIETFPEGMCVVRARLEGCPNTLLRN